MLKLKSAWFKYKYVHIVKTQLTQKRNNIMLGYKSKSFVLNITARFDESPPPLNNTTPFHRGIMIVLNPPARVNGRILGTNTGRLAVLPLLQIPSRLVLRLRPNITAGDGCNLQSPLTLSKVLFSLNKWKNEDKTVPFKFTCFFSSFREQNFNLEDCYC